MSGDIGDEILGGYHGYFLFNSLNKHIELENRKITWKKFLRMWMNKYKKENSSYEQREGHRDHSGLGRQDQCQDECGTTL